MTIRRQSPPRADFEYTRQSIAPRQEYIAIYALQSRAPPWDGSAVVFEVTATAEDCRYTEAAISAGAADVSLPLPIFPSGTNEQKMYVEAIFVNQETVATITGPSEASADPPRVTARHVSPPATCRRRPPRVAAARHCHRRPPRVTRWDSRRDSASTRVSPGTPTTAMRSSCTCS